MKGYLLPHCSIPRVSWLLLAAFLLLSAGACGITLDWHSTDTSAGELQGSSHRLKGTAGQMDAGSHAVLGQVTLHGGFQVMSTAGSAAWIEVSPLSLAVSEPLGTAQVTIRLTSQPINGASVTIPLSAIAGVCLVDSAEATITSANWSVGVDVLVTAVNDATVNLGGSRQCTVITGNPTSSDSRYDSLNGDDVADVVVTVIDDDGVCHTTLDTLYGPLSYTGSTTIASNTTLRTSGSVAIEGGANMVFQAATGIGFGPGFRVETGGIFTARIDPASCSLVSSSRFPIRLLEDEEKLTDEHGAVAQEDLLYRLRELWATGLAWGFSGDADGQHFLFVTAEQLMDIDDNGLADVYLYLNGADEVRLISRAPDGMPGDGASDQPRLSVTGEFGVFRSDAGNLTQDDTNETGDVYLVEISTGQLRRVSWSERGNESLWPSSYPVLSVASLEVLYERPDQFGRGRIFSFSMQQGVTRLLSPQICDAHRPGISIDGRYMTYLCLTPGERTCTVRLEDKEWNGVEEMECFLPADTDYPLPWFSPEGMLEWRYSHR